MDDPLGTGLDIVLDRCQVAVVGGGIVGVSTAYFLSEKGYDPAYGARPLKRAIQKAVQDPLAELILSGQVKYG